MINKAKAILLFLLVISFCLFSAENITAYDHEAHYAWTYYLALQVGYTPRQAYQIASASFAIDEDPDTGPMEAGASEAILGADVVNEPVRRVWAHFHAFGNAEFKDNPKEVENGREKHRQELWSLAKLQRNPGPLIHFTQDYYSHFDYYDFRAHIHVAHQPDFLSNDPEKARKATIDTVKVLKNFMSEVLQKKPNEPNYARVWQLLDELIAANPAPWLISPNNYAPPWNLPKKLEHVGRPNLEVALAKIQDAINSDPNLLPLWPAKQILEMPSQWIPYEFNSNGEIEEKWAKQYPVEQLKIELGKEVIETNKIIGSASQTVHMRIPYKISGIRDLRYWKDLPVTEEYEISGMEGPPKTSKNSHSANSEVEDYVVDIDTFVDNPKSDITLTWNSSIHVYGLDLISKQGTTTIRSVKNETLTAEQNQQDSNQNLREQLDAAKAQYTECDYQNSLNTLNSILGKLESADETELGSIIHEVNDYISRNRQAISGAKKIEAQIHQARTAKDSCNLAGSKAALDEINGVEPPNVACKSKYQIQVEALKQDMALMQLDQDFYQGVVQQAEDDLLNCRFKTAIESAEWLLTSLNEQCSESIKMKADEIKARAERMIKTDDEIDTEITLAELAIAKNISNKREQIQTSMANVNSMIAKSGNAACFQKYLEVVKVFEKVVGKNPLDGLGLDQYGREGYKGENIDGWGQATKDAAESDSEILDVTPRESKSTTENDNQAGNTGNSDWGEVLTEVIEGVTTAVIKGKNPELDLEHSNPPDNTNEGLSNNENFSFVGTWAGQFTLASHYSPRNSDGDEICSWQSPSSNQEFSISQNGSAYVLETTKAQFRSTYSGDNRIEFSESANGISVTVSFNLLEKNALEGTMEISSNEGCRDVVSISAFR